MRLKRILTVAAVLALLALAHLIGTAARPAPQGVPALDDLDKADRRIGVIAGHGTEKVARSAFAQARLVSFSDPEDAVVALLAGQLDGFVHDEHVLNVRARAYPNRLAVLDETLAKSPAVVLVSNRRPELQAALNRFIAGLRTAGAYDDMLVRWCQSDRFVPMPKIPEPKRTEGVLRVGTGGVEEPSSFCDDAGELTGFDVEFARRFAQLMRCELQIECRPVQQLLERLGSGALDLVVDDCKAHDVPPGVLVSDTYFDTDVKVMVRAGDDAACMLGSARLGWSGRLFGDPRLSLFATGALTTLALSLLASVIGLLLTFALHLLARRFSGSAVRSALDVLLETARLLPPPVVLLAFGCVLTGVWAGAFLAVLTLAFRFAAFVEPTFFTDRRTAIRTATERLIELVQWTSVVGILGVCDLTQAADLVCGRTPVALGALVSVAAVYGLLGWSVKRMGAWLERTYA